MNKNKEKDYFRQGHLPLGDKKSLLGELPHLLGDGKPCVADCLIGAEQKTSDQPVKATFLGRAVTIIRSGIKLCFGVAGLAQVTPFGPVASF